jgi:type I restriction enzyme M protein
VALKKSELYSSIWKSCDELRGGMDASQYKDYVLVLLFVKYVSDRYAGQKDALITVPKGASFADMVALKGDKEIGDKINKIIARLAAANDLKGAIDVADFNDADKLGKGKEMVDRLSNLVAIFDKPELNFSANRAEGDDLLGDAYEFLMRHFATESGKSKGQFYTPAEVSRIMAKVIGLGDASSGYQTIYDPTCGSGSLVIKAHDEALSMTGHDLSIYGQEQDNATTALARMNMILHGITTAEIAPPGSSSLANPFFKTQAGRLKTHDFVVANPPFSTKAWSNGFDPANDLYGRFDFGIPPRKNGDYAFLLHVLASLKPSGKAAIIMPHGVLFRGGSEGEIRREIVRRGFIKGIVGLPPNLFYGTGIPACIIVLDKEYAAARTDIFMIDASTGYLKDGNKNRLRAQDIHKIVDAFTRPVELPRFSRMVPVAEIEANEFNLNLPRYIDTSEPEDLQDIDGHLRGGIPNRDIDALDRYWQVFPGVRDALFRSADRPGYCELKVPTNEVKSTTLGHPEFTAFNASVTALFDDWKEENRPRLVALGKKGHPKTLIEALSEDLLEVFKNAKLINPYDVYQHLMNYWAETMQDDVYQVVRDGWKGVVDGRPNTDLIPESHVVRRYFATERQTIDHLASDREAVTRQIEELEEEHAGEEGLLAGAKNDKDKLTKASVKARLGQVDDDAEAADERKVLRDYLALVEHEAEVSKKVKDAEEVFAAKVSAKYSKLTVEELKAVVIDDKWLRFIGDAVQTELNGLSVALGDRVLELAERYATPLPRLVAGAEVLTDRVATHLKGMGATWA